MSQKYFNVRNFSGLPSPGNMNKEGVRVRMVHMWSICLGLMTVVMVLQEMRIMAVIVWPVQCELLNTTG